MYVYILHYICPPNGRHIACRTSKTCVNVLQLYKKSNNLYYTFIEYTQRSYIKTTFTPKHMYIKLSHLLHVTSCNDFEPQYTSLE